MNNEYEHVEPGTINSDHAQPRSDFDHDAALDAEGSTGGIASRRAAWATPRSQGDPYDPTSATASDYRAMLMSLADQEERVVAAMVEMTNERARAARAAAAVLAADTAADEVVRTAAAIRSRVTESALRVATAASEAVAFTASSVPPGNEAEAARSAARLALAVLTEAMAVAVEAGVAAAVVAEAAGAAATDMAALTADAEMTIELDECRAADNMRGFVGETARRVATEAVNTNTNQPDL